MNLREKTCFIHLIIYSCANSSINMLINVQQEKDSVTK